LYVINFSWWCVTKEAIEQIIFYVKENGGNEILQVGCRNGLTAFFIKKEIKIISTDIKVSESSFIHIE
jgi:hypothetical protein